MAGEFALVAVSRSRVEFKAASGDRRAARVLGRLKDLSFELSGAQLGITISSLILGAIAEPTVARLLAPLLAAAGVESAQIALVTALVLATAAQMVLGELIPKNVAIAHPYPTAIRIGLPMAVVNRLQRPLVLWLNASANWTCRRLGIEPRDDLAGLRSLQELEMIVRASGAEGGLDARETSLLTRAIAFVGRDATDVMVPRVSVVGIPADASVEELRALSLQTGHSRFPVFGDDPDNVIGIAYVKDTFRIPAEARRSTTVAEIASTVEVVPESMRLDTILIELQRAGRTIAVVVDEYGGNAGIVTVEDIVEEILGEIADEHDTDETSGTSGEVHGGLHRHEVAELTGFLWPAGGYETLNGFVTSRLERFPQPGDVVECDDYRIEVLTVEDRVADQVAVTRSTGGEAP